MRHSQTLLLTLFLAGSAFAADQVKTANGTLESTTVRDGVRMFRGIPFAQPPVGDLRWKEPQPPQNWTGSRNADKWGARCMQRTGGDYWPQTDSMSEDCLYLNVWTPAKKANEKLPVLVYFFGGGFTSGDGSERRYDGESMARKGITVVTVNYRLGIFGFMSHPDLTKESAHHASGNYGYLDQVAALQWVQKNIAAFGGDPKHVTIAGESAGSISVSALMGSPLSKGLINAAIGESGAMMSTTLPGRPLAETEKDGVTFQERAGATNLSALRALSTDQIMNLTAPAPGGRGGAGVAGASGPSGAARGPAPPALSFTVNIDGYFLPKTLTKIFEAGEQAKVPLLAGTNSAEQGAASVLGQDEPTPAGFAAAIHRLYPNPDDADRLLKVYAPTNQDEVFEAATALASARFISLSTWKWAELQTRTGKPVYRYYYSRVRPAYTGMPGDAAAAGPAGGGRGAGRGGPGGASGPGRGPGGGSGFGRGGGRGGPQAPPGAAHSAEIQYAMGNLNLDTRYAWTADDHKVSDTMQGFFANFVKTYNPNGAGLPQWPTYDAKSNYTRMHLDVASKAEPEPDRARYQTLDAIVEAAK